MSRRGGTSRRARVVALAGAVSAIVALAVAGCSDDPVTRSPAVAETDGAHSQDGPRHVHGLAVLGSDAYLATHTGVWRLAAGERAPVRVGDDHRDVMGFTTAGGTMLGSGHPEPGSGEPPHVGLIVSEDRGESWASVALAGRADFHALTASGRTVYGYNGLDGQVLVSRDRRSFAERAAPGQILSIAADPGRPSRVIATTAEGMAWISTDSAARWRPLPWRHAGLVAWSASGEVFGITGSGDVYSAKDPQRPWRRVGTVGGPPAAIATSGTSRVHVALADATVLTSDDGGRSFEDFAAKGP